MSRSQVSDHKMVTFEGEIMDHVMRLWRQPLGRVVTAAMLLIMLAGLGGVVTMYTITKAHSAANSCQLNSPASNLQHVISIPFHNTHFTRDNPKSPSYLHPMTNLRNFIATT